MASSLRAPILIVVFYALVGALSVRASDDSTELLTCVYTVDALTSTAAYAQSHGGAFLIASNSDGANVTLHLLRPGLTDSSEYTFLAGEHFNFVGTGPCVSGICKITIYMDSDHNWLVRYFYVATGNQYVWFDTDIEVTEDATSIDQCSSSSTVITKHGKKPRKYIRSVV